MLQSEKRKRKNKLNLKKKKEELFSKYKPYREPLEPLVAIGHCVRGSDFDGGGGCRVVVRELNDRQRLERRRGREQRVVTESSKDLKEDLEEEGQPVQERPPYLQRPRRVYLGLSQLGHRNIQTEFPLSPRADEDDYMVRRILTYLLAQMCTVFANWLCKGNVSLPVSPLTFSESEMRSCSESRNKYNHALSINVAVESVFVSLVLFNPLFFLLFLGY